jgi:hypothetical protein
MAWQCSRASGSEDILEKQSWVRDNQTQIDAKQVEIDTVLATRLPIEEAYNLKWNELQELMTSGADQELIDITQSEADLLNSQYHAFDTQLEILNQDFANLENNSQWVRPDTFSNRNTDYRANRDAFFKAMNELALGGDLSTQYGPNGQGITEEEFATMRADFLNFNFLDNSPNPWSDEAYRFAWGDGINPVEGAQNSTIHNYISGDWGQNTMTNHPLGTMPFEVLPNVTKINRLPAVASVSLLPEVGNPGDVIRILSEGDEYAWDPQNQEWSRGFYTRFLGTFDEHIRPIRDAKLKAKNELALAMRPHLFAALHIPSFCLSTSDVIEK